MATGSGATEPPSSRASRLRLIVLLLLLLPVPLLARGGDAYAGQQAAAPDFYAEIRDLLNQRLALQDEFPWAPRPREVPGWPGPLPWLGEVSGVSVRPDGHPVIFHRGPRIWDARSFNASEQYQRAEEGAIPVETVVTLHRVTGEPLDAWGRDFFYLPHGITVDALGNTWLTDVALHQVFKFPPGGEGRPELALGERFVPGAGPHRFCKPTSVAVARAGQVFVADGYCNSRVLEFNARGRLLRELPMPEEMTVSFPRLMARTGTVVHVGFENFLSEYPTPAGQAVMSRLASQMAVAAARAARAGAAGGRRPAVRGGPREPARGLPGGRAARGRPAARRPARRRPRAPARPRPRLRHRRQGGRGVCGERAHLAADPRARIHPGPAGRGGAGPLGARSGVCVAARPGRVSQRARPLRGGAGPAAGAQVRSAAAAARPSQHQGLSCSSFALAPSSATHSPGRPLALLQDLHADPTSRLPPQAPASRPKGVAILLSILRWFVHEKKYFYRLSVTDKFYRLVYSHSINWQNKVQTCF